VDYSKSILLYEDKPAYDSIVKLILPIVPVALLATGLYLWHTGQTRAAATLAGEAVFVGLIFWAVFPRSYRVYEDHLRIVLGGPLAVKIGFERIAKIEVTRRNYLSVNYATRMTNTYVVIVKWKGLAIAITPSSNGAFVENAETAIRQWAATRRAGF
jgi:hypothetical protein